MSDARLVLRTRTALHGGVVEVVVWPVPEPAPPSLHGFKYRLVFAQAGERVVGYDNDRGKGDHKHIGALERPYPFSDLATLINDFLADVEALR